MKWLIRDFRYALRGVRRNPAPSLAVIATLALGIGPVTAVFSAVYGILLRPLPYQAAQDLVQLRQPGLDGGGPLPFNVPELADYRDLAPSMEGLVEYHTLWFNLIENGEPERVQTGVVSWNYFDVLGVRPLHGRTFVAGDDESGAPAVLVLSHEYWMRRFGGDARVVGRVVEMNQLPHEIVGVLPPIPRYPNSDDDVYMPGSACPFRTPAWLDNRSARALTVFGRVRDGVPLERAREELLSASRTLQLEYAASYPPGRTFAITATPLLEELTSAAQPTLIVLLVTATFVLLIVCANVANLTLARVLGRERDLALRTALGAGRHQIARQLLAESVMLSLLGGALGLALARASGGVLTAFASRFSPRVGDVAFDGPVLLFAFAASVGTGLLVGAVAALPTRADPAAALRDGGQKGSGGGLKVRSGLLVGQVALSSVLLIGAGLAIKSLSRLQAVDTGFDPARVLSARIDLDFSRYTPAGRSRAGLAEGPAPLDFWERLLDRLALEPRLSAHGLASNVPLAGGVPQLQFAVEGREPDAAATVRWNVVSEGYLQAAGIPLLSGRDLASTDRGDAPRVALVSRLLAERYWGGQSPLGSFVSPDGTNWYEVVGVVADVRQVGLATPPDPQAYVTIRQTGGLGATLLVRTSGEPADALPVVRDVVRDVDPLQPVGLVRTLEQVHRDAVAPERLTALLLVLLAVLAAGVAAAGIAGVMAYAVARRTREIGIRLALGATPVEVRWMVIRDALLLVAAGVAAGVAAAALLARPLGGLLYETSPFDPLTYAGAGLLITAVGLLAAAAPALRSSRVDPVHALGAD